MAQSASQTRKSKSTKRSLEEKAVSRTVVTRRGVTKKTVRVQKDRIEMRVDPNIKKLAERASVTLGFASLTEYVTQLIRENAPKVLEEETSIVLANDQFDRFVEACNDTELKPSQRILDAAKRLDAEGY